MIRMGVSGCMFLLVPAYPGSPGPKAVKRLCVCVCVCVCTVKAKFSNYTVVHNYGNPYEKWNIFVPRPHLWLQLGMVQPEIMLCETVLNLSTLNTLTYLRTACMYPDSLGRNGSAHY